MTGGPISIPFQTHASSLPWQDRYRRPIQLFRLAVRYSFVQAMAQALGLLAGILVVRSLTKEAYAYFLIANTIGPMMTLLSDTGITSSLSAIGGRFWQDDGKMGRLIQTATVLRRQMFVASALAVAPVLAWMLWRNHAPIAIACTLVPLTLLGVFFQLQAGVLNVVIGLRQQVSRMQVLVLSSAVPRLAVIAGLAAFGLLNAPLAIAAGCLAPLTQSILLARWVRPQIAWPAAADPALRHDILAVVKRQAPLTIYFCLQSQIGIWLISSFGDVHGVAEVGALSRIGMIFGVLISATSALVVPRFARCQDPVRLRAGYWQILLGYAAIVALGAAVAWAFPQPLVALLGEKYEGSRNLVWLGVLAHGSASFTGLLHSLNVNRNWIPPAAIVVPVDLLNQLAVCLCFDFSTVEGVLWIGVIAPAIPALMNLFFGWRRLAAMENPASQPL